MLSTRWWTAHVSRCQLRTNCVHARSLLADMENVHSLTTISHPPRKNTRKLTKIDPIYVEAMPFSERCFKKQPTTTYCCTESSRTPFYVCINIATVDHNRQAHWQTKLSPSSSERFCFMNFRTAVRHKTNSTYGKTPRKAIRTSNSYSSSDIPWHNLEGQIIPKICDGKTISRMISKNQDDRVNESGRNDATIMLWVAELSKMHTSKERPARVRFRSRARNRARGASPRILEATDPLSSDCYSRNRLATRQHHRRLINDRAQSDPPMA
jgi:hypothetical protein